MKLMGLWSLKLQNFAAEIDLKWLLGIKGQDSVVLTLHI